MSATINCLDLSTISQFVSKCNIHFYLLFFYSTPGVHYFPLQLNCRIAAAHALEFIILLRCGKNFDRNCISHVHEYTVLLFPPKKKNIDENVIYQARQLTILLSLKSLETVQFTIYAERGENAYKFEVN